jgi:hypothetical protein
MSAPVAMVSCLLDDRRGVHPTRVEDVISHLQDSWAQVEMIAEALMEAE